MSSKASAEQAFVARQLRPLVILVAAVNLAVATLLITTASLGATPIDSVELASLR
ncbi:hypothetical protein JJB09_07925 [Rhizobium sp. KVB221]|uniref:Uncharacterized protein n=1 Tax=Rhizobium setariae TaxID=2801340 RepID=A0A936YSN6_9HYPH|nr:hypothetical protein [Rhizobium setariae]MBL0371952.1 hypothetical protein [Rhizobium setariae]